MGSLLIECLTVTLLGRQGIVSQAQAFFVVGLLGWGLAKAVTSVSAGLQFVWRQYLRPGKKLSKYGKWAIVTGATDGIGRAYCDELAKQGMSIYLVSRTEAKLQEAAQQISQKFGVETKYYAADLAAAGKEPIDQSCWFGLKSNISGMDIGVLINNAGMSYGHPEYFHQLDPAEVDTMVAFNCASLVKMTYIVLPGMVERGRGAILNLGSASATGVPACPLLSLYAGTKCFVDAFSRCLDAEYKSKGIDVQVQSPSLVATKLAKVRPSLMSPSPKTYTSVGVRFVLVDLLPKSMAISLVSNNAKLVRAKGLKKKAAANKNQ